MEKEKSIVVVQEDDNGKTSKSEKAAAVAIAGLVKITAPGQKPKAYRTAEGAAFAAANTGEPITYKFYEPCVKFGCIAVQVDVKVGDKELTGQWGYERIPMFEKFIPKDFDTFSPEQFAQWEKRLLYYLSVNPDLLMKAQTVAFRSALGKIGLGTLDAVAELVESGAIKPSQAPVDLADWELEGAEEIPGVPYGGSSNVVSNVQSKTTISPEPTKEKGTELLGAQRAAEFVKHCTLLMGAETGKIIHETVGNKPLDLLTEADAKLVYFRCKELAEKRAEKDGGVLEDADNKEEQQQQPEVSTL